MAQNGYRWLMAATVAAGISGAALADGDGGDSSMNPFYGDSWAALEGNGHNLNQPNIGPSGAFVAHEMDGQGSGVPLAEKMRQTQARAAAFAERMRQQTLAALRPSSASSPSPTSSGATGPSSMNSGATSPSSTSPDSTSSTSGTNSGVRIAPVNPKGQAPTIVGPTSSVAPGKMPANTFEDSTGG